MMVLIISSQERVDETASLGMDLRTVLSAAAKRALEQLAAPESALLSAPCGGKNVDRARNWAPPHRNWVGVMGSNSEVDGHSWNVASA